MSNDEHNVSDKHDTRPTIAYLAHGIGGNVGKNRWRGIADATKAHDANLLCFVGNYYGFPGLQQANIAYSLVPHNRIDGIVMGNIMRGSFLSPEEIDAFYARFPFPIVGFESRQHIPYIASGHYEGIREILAHVIEVHGCRRIAFARGPATHHVPAQEQYQAYLDTLRERDLPQDPRLISPPCDWAEDRDGKSIVQVLLDERGLRPGIDFDAIFIPDYAALYLIRTLAERGIRVPADVAVVGVDNRMEGAVFTPPSPRSISRCTNKDVLR